MKRRTAIRQLLLTTSAIAIAASLSAEAQASCTVVGSTGLLNPSGSTLFCVNLPSGSATGDINNQGTIFAGATSHVAVSIANFGTLNGTILNSGTIQVAAQTGNVATGIHLNTAASVSGVISNSGLIDIVGHSKAAGTAIGIHASQTFFGGGISNSGTILATKAFAVMGIDVARNLFGETSTFTAGIANSGLISASGQNTGIGIFAEVSNFSGGVSNSGTINAAASGFAANGIVVEGSTFTGGISNSGVLNISNSGATGLAHASGIFVAFESAFSGGVSNSGTINVTLAGGEGVGISINNVSHFTGSVSNSGPITVSGADFGAGIFVNSVFHINSTSVTGNISNSGSISVTAVDSGYGIYVRNTATMVGNVVNSGSIGVTAGTRAAGIDLQNPTSFIGGVTNSGTIGVSVSGAEGQAGGIIVSFNSEFAGNVLNAGVITVAAPAGTATGIGVFGSRSGDRFGTSSIAGGITNNGSISVTAGIDGYGIFLSDAGTVFGNVVNSGSIGVSAGRTGYGIFVQNPTTFVGGISNSGTIGVTAGGSGYGIYLRSPSSFVGNIGNSGTITVNAGGFGAGIFVDTSRSGFFGGTTFKGNIVNSGLIDVVAAGSAVGIGVSNVPNWNGGVTNSGTISVTSGASRSATGIGVYNIKTWTGGVNNSGLINVSAGSSGYGIYLQNATSVTGSVVNSGTINVTAAAAGYGIYIHNTSVFSGNIDNSGTISVTAGGFGAGIMLDSSHTGFFGRPTIFGSVVNSGAITVSAGGSGYGIYLKNFGSMFGGVTNSGTIGVTAGTFGAGIALINSTSNGSATLEGNVINSGTISVSAGATGYGIYLHNVTSVFGSIVNSGLIDVKAGGNAAGIFVDPFNTFFGGIGNSGTISVNAVGSAVGIGVTDFRSFGNNSTFFSASINSGIITTGIDNSGLITVVAGGEGAGIGVRNFDSFFGGITNSGTINVTAGGNGFGIAVHSFSGFFGGNTFGGAIVNSGTISVTAGLSAYGIEVSDFFGMFGGVTNSGLIDVTAKSGDAFGINIANGVIVDGGVTNFGTIMAVAEGATASGVGHNAFGISVEISSFNGGVTNAGLIEATSTKGNAFGINAGGITFNGGVVNTSSGVIVATAGAGAHAYGIYVGATKFNGGITNAGLIAAGETTPGVHIGGSGIGIYSASATIGSIVNTGTIMGSEFAIDLSSPSISGSTTITNSGAIFGGLNLSDTVTDTVNNTGYVEANIYGAAAVYNQTAGVFHVLTGTSVGTPDPVSVPGTPINTFNATGGEILFDITATPSDPLTTAHNGVTGNGFISALNFTATDAVAFHVGLTPNQNYVPGALDPTTKTLSIDYHNILNGVNSFAGPTTPTPVTIDNGSFVLSAQILPDTPVTGGEGAGSDMLVLTRSSFTAPGNGFSGGLTPNQIAAAQGLDGLANTNPSGAGAILGPLFTTTNPNTFRSELTQLSGFQFAAGLDAGVGVPVFTVDQVQTIVAEGPRDGNWIASAKFAASGIQIANGGDITTDASQQTAQVPGAASSSGVYSPWTFWGRGYGVFGTATGQQDIAGYDERRGGGIVGAEYQVSDDLLVGAVANYANTDISFNNFAGDTSLDTYLFGLYGQYRMGPIHFDLTGGGGFSNYTTDRNITLPINAVAHSSYNGQTYFVYGESGYDLEFNQAKITPFVGISYLHSHLDGFTESGAQAADLTSAGADKDSIETSLGVRASTSVMVGTALLVPEVRAIWQHELGDDRSKITQAFALSPASPFTVQGLKLGNDAAVIGGGVSYDANDRVKLFLDYDAKLEDSYTAHAVTGGVRVKF